MVALNTSYCRETQIKKKAAFAAFYILLRLNCQGPSLERLAEHNLLSAYAQHYTSVG